MTSEDVLDMSASTKLYTLVIVPPSNGVAIKSQSDTFTVLDTEKTTKGNLGAPKLVNRLYMGGDTQVSTILGFNLPPGYAAQVTSFGTKYRNLEGPVFGMRVGIYHSDSSTHGWKSIGDEKSTKDYRMVMYKWDFGNHRER